MVDLSKRPDIADRLRLLKESYAQQLTGKFLELTRLADSLRKGADSEVIHRRRDRQVLSDFRRWAVPRALWSRN